MEKDDFAGVPQRYVLPSEPEQPSPAQPMTWAAVVALGIVCATLVAVVWVFFG